MEKTIDLSQLDYRALTPAQQSAVRGWAVERARQLRAEALAQALRWLFGRREKTPALPARGRLL